MHTKSEEPLQCTKCDQHFDYKSDLFAHVAAEHKKETWNCTQCDEIFDKEDSLKRLVIHYVLKINSKM